MLLLFFSPADMEHGAGSGPSAGHSSAGSQMEVRLVELSVMNHIENATNKVFCAILIHSWQKM